jgi:hypothetical protein
MDLTPGESRFLTALAREQNQTGCRGPAHDLLRKHVYAHAPISGPGSMAFSYDAVPLINVLLKNFKNLQEIDDFLRQGERITDPQWPWFSAEEYRVRLALARGEQAGKKLSAV